MRKNSEFNNHIPSVNLPQLCTPRDVGARILLQQRTDAAKAAAESVAMDVESDEEEGAAAPTEDDWGGERRAEVGDQEVEAETEELRQRLEKQHTGSTVTQPAPAAPTAGNVIIRDYDPRKGWCFKKKGGGGD